MVFLALLATGLAAGTLAAMLGLGGGIFLVPALTLLFDLPMRVAVGASLVSVIATSAGVAAVMPRGRGPDVGLGLRLQTVAAGGAVLGGSLAGWISQRALSVLFGGVVLAVAGYVVLRFRRRPGSTIPAEALYRWDYHPRNWTVGLGTSGLGGMLSGLLGVGAGFIHVPVMYAVMDVPLGVATATSNFLVGITASASVFVYYGRGDIRPMVAIPTAIGVFTGAILGVYVLSRLRAAVVRWALISLLLVIGAEMLRHGFR